jgi:hypothetical protein
MSKLGKMLIAAANEGIAIARGEADPATYRITADNCHPEIYTGPAVGAEFPNDEDELHAVPDRTSPEDIGQAG